MMGGGIDGVASLSIIVEEMRCWASARCLSLLIPDHSERFEQRRGGKCALLIATHI